MVKPSETLQAARWVKQRVDDWKAAPDSGELNQILRRLGRWRSRLLANTFVVHHGARIIGGPFAGMEYVTEAAEGALIPCLLGTYESELHPHFAAIVAGGLDCVINIGCAEGYYAVGLARTSPRLHVYAHDIDPAAQEACRALAERNDVADRVTVAGAFPEDGFEAFAGQRALVVMDIEGAEVDLLRPDLQSALTGMSLIVETHDAARRGALATLMERFAPTHEIVRVDQQAKALDPPGWLKELAHLDQLLAVWEWRASPTPWLVMRPK